MDKDNEKDTEIMRYGDRCVGRDSFSLCGGGQRETQDNPWREFRSKPKGLKTRSTDVQGQVKMDIPGQADMEHSLPLPFCSVQTVN